MLNHGIDSIVLSFFFPHLLSPSLCCQFMWVYAVCLALAARLYCLKSHILKNNNEHKKKTNHNYRLKHHLLQCMRSNKLFFLFVFSHRFYLKKLATVWWIDCCCISSHFLFCFAFLRLYTVVLFFSRFVTHVIDNKYTYNNASKTILAVSSSLN